MSDSGTGFDVLALQTGLITEKQLMDCLDAQRAEGSKREIQEIMVEKGYLTSEDINNLLKLSAEKKRVNVPDTPGSKRGTGVLQKPTGKSTTRPLAVKRSGTAVRKPTGPVSAPPPPPPSTKPGSPVPTPGRERSTKISSRPQPSTSGARHSRKTIAAGILFAFVPVAALIGFLVYRGGSGDSSHGSAKAPGSISSPPTDLPINKGTAKEPIAKSSVADIRVAFPLLSDNSDLALRWNRVADALNKSSDVMAYAQRLGEIQRIVGDAKGSPHEKTLAAVYGKVLEAIDAQAARAFEFIDGESARLVTAGKYGDAVAAWAWFPSVLDPVERYRAKIEECQKRTKANGLKSYESLKQEVSSLVAARKFQDAKLKMLRALESGLKEITDDAYKRLGELTDAEDSASRKAEEESIAEFEKHVREQKETGAVVDALRGRFWELVRKRKIENAASFLQSEKAARNQPEAQREVETLSAVLEAVKDLFSLAETVLKARVGTTATLAFDDDGKALVRTLQIRDVSNGKLVIVIEGKQITEAVARLHSSELLKYSDNVKDEKRSAVLSCVSYLLADEFDKAHGRVTAAGESGTALVRFIEASSGFLAKNADGIRREARSAIEAKEYDRAIAAWTKLVAVPALRKEALRERARTYYLAENFIGAVLDVESLFEMDVVDKAAIGILNQSYERSALIAKAIRIYENASLKMPEDATILGNLVSLYIKIHEYGKAREALGRVQKLKNANLDLNLAIHLLGVAEEGAFTGTTYKAKLGRYDLETDRSQEWANEMVQFMDNLYGEYAKVFPYKKNESLRFHVKLFANENGFARYFQRVTGADIRQGMGKVLAYYLPPSKELVGWNDPDVKEILRHEGFHQYIDYFVDKCPVWFNEGYATYFMKSTPAGPVFDSKQHGGAKAAMAAKLLPGLRELLLMPKEVWESKDQKAFFYSESWSFIYFLVKQGRKDVLDKYFDELMKGRTQPQAFEAVFGPGRVNLDELEAKWRLAVFNDKYD